MMIICVISLFVVIMTFLFFRVLSVSGKVVSASYVDGVLTVHYNDGTRDKYKGSCTVWYSYPYMRRCGTSEEMWLCNIWKYVSEHGNPYPTAHKK